MFGTYFLKADSRWDAYGFDSFTTLASSASVFFDGDLLSGSMIFAIEKLSVLDDGGELFDTDDSAANRLVAFSDDIL